MYVKYILCMMDNFRRPTDVLNNFRIYNLTKLKSLNIHKTVVSINYNSQRSQNLPWFMYEYY